MKLPTLFCLPPPILALAAHSAGCGKDPVLKPGASGNFTIESSGGTRSYVLHLPENYSPATPHPVIFAFHGRGDTGRGQQESSGLDTAKWNPHGITAYPDGVDGKWQGAPYSEEGVLDTVFVGDLLDRLEDALCVDTSRVYATGMSNGGGFCNVMACSETVSHRFAAFAPVAGAFYAGNAEDGSDCHPEHAVTPILDMHGLEDETIKYHGGLRRGVPTPDVLEWTERWARRGGCSRADSEDPAVEELYDGNVKHYRWPCADNTVEHYAIAGLGHSWPTKNNTYFDATSVIVRWLSRHAIPEATSFGSRSRRARLGKLPELR